jgi:hypothetical protein
MTQADAADVFVTEIMSTNPSLPPPPAPGYWAILNTGEQRADRTEHSRPRVRKITPKDEDAERHKRAEKFHRIFLPHNAKRSVFSINCEFSYAVQKERAKLSRQKKPPRRAI